MRKLTVTLCAVFMFAGAALCPAEEFDAPIDVLIKNAVEGLSSQLNTVMEVSVGDITLAGTDSFSALSRYLENRITAHAPNTKNSLFTLVPRTRGIPRAKAGQQRGLIKGTFLREGATVRITLQLVSEAGGAVLVSRDFSVPAAELDGLGIAVMPENVKTPEEIKEREKILEPPALVSPALVSPVLAPRALAPTSQTFTIKAWPNSDSSTYYDGDTLEINIEADRDCYFKVYHIDVDKNMQMLYPNQLNRDNFLKAHTIRAIPEAPVSINLHQPFGLESIWVIASTRPFVDVEAEFVRIRQAAAAEINSIRGDRGASLSADLGTEASAEARFNFAILSGR